MNKIILNTIIFLVFTSCSTLQERTKKRELQSKIIRALNSKIADFSNCAAKNDIYTKFNAQRVRVELQLKLNSKGQVEMFQLDNKSYDEKFVDCIFKTIDIIIFPALGKDEAIELTQPMIFTKK